LLKILRLQLSGGSQVCDDNWATRGGIDQAPNFTSGVETMRDIAKSCVNHLLERSVRRHEGYLTQERHYATSRPKPDGANRAV
jgi:hypothetical protein